MTSSRHRESFQSFPSFQQQTESASCIDANPTELGLLHLILECSSLCSRVTEMWTLALIVTLSLRILSVLANVEKTIFRGPEAIQIPKAHPNLEDLRLESLTPSHWSLRRQVVASFPNFTNAKGSETWLLLDGLEYNQRYEVRICWVATVSCTCQSHDGFLLFVFYYGDWCCCPLNCAYHSLSISNQQHSLLIPLRYLRCSTHPI